MEYMAAQMDRQIEGAQHAYEAAMQAGQQPAYPAQEKIEYPSSIVMEYHTGMTLRDHFAAKAMQGALANATIGQAFKERGLKGVPLSEWVARRAYKMADAMLKARATT